MMGGWIGEEAIRKTNGTGSGKLYSIVEDGENNLGKGQIMLMVTTEEIAAQEIVESLGLVRGSTVQSKHIGRDIMAGLKTIVGGELRGYTELLEDARETALRRLEDNARAVGADAVVNLRFTTSTIATNASEILAYGTAVKLA
nr:heavy metal-binding domain-containing protein [Paremcibacter congregatus]